MMEIIIRVKGPGHMTSKQVLETAASFRGVDCIRPCFPGTKHGSLMDLYCVVVESSFNAKAAKDLETNLSRVAGVDLAELQKEVE